MASHMPPPENEGGGAVATAWRMDNRVRRTLSGEDARKTSPGKLSAGSSSRWRRKNRTVQGILFAAEGIQAAAEESGALPPLLRRGFLRGEGPSAD